MVVSKMGSTSKKNKENPLTPPFVFLYASSYPPPRPLYTPLLTHPLSSAVMHAMLAPPLPPPSVPPYLLHLHLLRRLLPMINALTPAEPTPPRMLVVPIIVIASSIFQRRGRISSLARHGPEERRHRPGGYHGVRDGRRRRGLRIDRVADARGAVPGVADATGTTRCCWSR